MNRSLILTIAICAFSTAAFAAQCPHDMSGDAKSVIVEASQTVKASNPELSAKLDAISAMCCAMENLHKPVGPFSSGKPSVDAVRAGN